MPASEVGALLEGAVDLHVHPGPSPFPRDLSIVDAAREAHEAGFAGIVVKSHHHSMVTDVQAASAAVGGLPLPVFGGVALNNQVGGINPSAVELALNLGGRIVWFPTISSDQHICVHNEEMKFPHTTRPYRKDTPTPVCDADGTVLPEVRDVIDLIKENDAILSGGHMGVDDLDAVIRAAHEQGVRKIIVSHPNFVIGAEPDRCRAWVEFGVQFEHDLCMYDDRSSFYSWTIDVMLDYVKATGVQASFLGSDLGQAGNPHPIDAYRKILGQLLEAGVPADDIRTMVSRNPRELLGV